MAAHSSHIPIAVAAVKSIFLNLLWNAFLRLYRFCLFLPRWSTYYICVAENRNWMPGFYRADRHFGNRFSQKVSHKVLFQWMCTYDCVYIDQYKFRCVSTETRRLWCFFADTTFTLPIYRLNSKVHFLFSPFFHEH